MIRRGTGVLLLTLGSLATGARFALAQCTPRAVVIGVSVYKDTEFTPLAHAREDALAFRDWFQNNTRCGNGVASAKPVITLLTNDNAGQGAIMQALSSVLLNASRNDEIFVFISARGLKTPDYTSGYLIGYDGVRGKLHPSGILVENLRDALPSRAGGRVFLFADISRDLPNKNDIVSNMQEILADNHALGALMSTKAKHVSFDAKGQARGLFTHVLIEELKANPGKKISLQSLFENLRRKVMEASKSKQEPVSFGAADATVVQWGRERILLASLGGDTAVWEPNPPRPASSQDSLPGPADGLLTQAFDLEAQAQAVLLRYGEGNHFPDDPQRPGAAEFERASVLFGEAQRKLPHLPVKELDDRLRTSLEARALFCRGGAMVYRGEYDEGRNVLKQAIAADPRLPEPHNAIGIAYLEQAQYTQAAMAFRQSIEVAPDWAYPRHNLALTYIEMGDNASAEAEYRAAIKRTPQHPYLYYNLGVLLQRINRRADAERCFQDAIVKFEQQAEAYRVRAALLNAEETAEHPAAKEAASIVLAEAGTTLRNEGEAHNALGALWQAGRKSTKAKNSYAKALDLNPQLSAARYNLAMMALRERHYADARHELEAVLKANPKFPQAEVRLRCANTGLQLARTGDREEKRRLNQDLRACMQ
jgi:tetratricopeptide (TPR) repeat protein